MVAAVTTATSCQRIILRKRGIRSSTSEINTSYAFENNFLNSIDFRARRYSSSSKCTETTAIVRSTRLTSACFSQAHWSSSSRHYSWMQVQHSAYPRTTRVQIRSSWTPSFQPHHLASLSRSWRNFKTSFKISNWYRSAKYDTTSTCTSCAMASWPAWSVSLPLVIILNFGLQLRLVSLEVKYTFKLSA